MAMARSAAGHESGVRMTAERVRGWTATEIAIDSLPIDSEERTRPVPRRDGNVILSTSLNDFNTQASIEINRMESAETR
jgi:hypothetical protein